MSKLQISDTLALPLDVVTQTIGIVAKRRVGKSFLARKLTEQLHAAGQQVVVLDPKGDWWGIRSSHDGRGPGLPILIIGGEHGDLPLETSSGEVVAKLVVEECVSALIDLSALRKHEVATFATAFLETLYRLKNREQYRTPLMLIVDESDAIAPQRPQPNEARMLGAIEDVVRRGGQRGIGCTFVTQRTAVLNKNVLTQAQILIALRTIAPQDLHAMNAWIDVHGEPAQRKTLMDSLPSLPVGDAWVWSPGWPTDRGIFQRIHTAPIQTFDSGATPKPGQKRSEPKTVAEVDLDAVRRQMAATIERAKADDPRELRRRIAEIEKQVRDKPKPTNVPRVTVTDLRALNDMARDVEAIRGRLAALRSRFHALGGGGDDFTPTDGASSVLTESPARTFMLNERHTTHTTKPQAKRERPNGSTAGALPKGESITLTAIAQYPHGVTRDQLTVVSGYKRSTRDAYVQRLRERGFVEVDGNTLLPTVSGRAALGADFEPLPTGEALQQYWLGKLPEGERAVLKAVLPAWPKPVDRERIGEVTGYKRSTRDAYIQRLRARQVVETIGGGVKSSDALFEVHS